MALRYPTEVSTPAWRKTKGNGSKLACLTMVFKMMQSAAKKWQLRKGLPILTEVIQGVRFVDGIREDKVAA